jgi:hypothetical protein
MKTKRLIMFITALLFNVVLGGAVSAATGFNPLAVIGGGLGLTGLFGSQTGVAAMAIQKEIWTSSLVEQLFADNSFMSRATNLDEFVEGKIVHIPQSGAASGVERNRTSLPATIKVRRDTDLYFGLDEYTTDPIKISNAEQVELSYNKRESILRNDKANLMKEVAINFIYDWSPTSSSFISRTTGSSVTAHVGTGNRKAFTTADVDAVATKFNADEMPQEGRVCLLDAYMYAQLLDSLTTSQNADFNKQADLARGVLGKYNTFEFMMRGTAAVYTTALAPKLNTDTSATTDNAAALFWHPNSVGRALGEVNAFEDLKNPQYYGDIYSFLVRAKGKVIRDDYKGVWACVQVAP